MASPNYQAQGTAQTGAGNLTVPWPGSHQAGDVALLFVETANEAVTLGTPAGFVEVTGSPQGTGTAAGLASTRLTVFWCRATSGAQASPVVTAPGNHARAQILTFRGCIDTGNPWDVTAGDVLAAASTAVTIPGATTTVIDCLCVLAVANGTDTNTAQTSAPMVNANLTGIAERADGNTTSGNGGGFGVDTGVKATTGATGTTTCTLTTGSVQGRMMIALKPVAATTVHTAGTLRATGQLFVATGMSLVSFAAPIRAPQARLVGQATAVISSATVDCASTLMVSTPVLQSPSQTLNYATGPLRVTQVRLVGQSTVVGTVNCASTLRATQARLIASATNTILHTASDLRATSARLTGTNSILSRMQSVLAASSARLIGISTANLGFTPIDGASDLRLTSARLVAQGTTLLHGQSTIAITSTRLLGGLGVLTVHCAGPIRATTPRLIGSAAAGGPVTPIAVHYRAGVLDRINHGTGRLEPIHGASVMDGMTADDTLHTADNTNLKADRGPMGRQI